MIQLLNFLAWLVVFIASGSEVLPQVGNRLDYLWTRQQVQVNQDGDYSMIDQNNNREVRDNSEAIQQNISIQSNTTNPNSSIITSNQLLMLQVAQTLEVFTTLTRLSSPLDIIYIIFDFKLIIRMLLVWTIVDQQIDYFLTVTLAFVWAFYDIYRLLIQAFPTFFVTTFIYNLYIILMPLQLYLNILLINAYKNMLSQNPQAAFYIIKIYALNTLMLFMSVFMIVRWVNMYNQRQRYYFRQDNIQMGMQKRYRNKSL